MSDEDERQTSSNMNTFYETNNRRLSNIKLKLQELTREKAKYNVEKLVQDSEFLQSEIGHLTHDIAEINKEINTQIAVKKNLNTKMAILRSNSGLRYANLQIALSDKARYEKELEKPNKSEAYRDLARRQIKSICDALPQLEKQDEHNQNLKQAEEKQIIAQNKREKLQESLNTKSRKQAEIRQLLNDSNTKLPELEKDIEDLRLEREQILNSMSGKKQQRRSTTTIQPKLIDSPIQSFASSLEHDTLEHEKQNSHDQLEKINLLIKYFHEKLSEHNLIFNDQTVTTPTELISPLYQPITPLEEQSILSSYMNDENNEIIKKNSSDKINNQSNIAIAMKLPRNFLSLDLNSTNNEIIHSPCYPQKLIQYKKELPNDILDKYAGNTNKKQQQFNQGKKNKKNKKNFGIKHSSQMIILYNDVRTLSGNCDTLPSMPMFEYELGSTIKSLEFLKQSIESYLNELSQRELSIPIDDIHSQILDDDDIRDSALDTYSETSSLIETINTSKNSTSTTLHPQLINIPEARSSSSSDDKKTIVSSSSPPSSHHSHSKIENQSLINNQLTTVQELPPLTIQIAQIDRQISDEGYRSVRNEQQQTISINNSPLLIRSASYDCTEKVDKWLSTTTPPLPSSIHVNNNHTDFQATDIDNEEDENLIEPIIPVSNN